MDRCTHVWCRSQKSKGSRRESVCLRTLVENEREHCLALPVNLITWTERGSKMNGNICNYQNYWQNTCMTYNYETRALDSGEKVRRNTAIWGEDCKVWMILITLWGPIRPILWEGGWRSTVSILRASLVISSKSRIHVAGTDGSRECCENGSCVFPTTRC